MYEKTQAPPMLEPDEPDSQAIGGTDHEQFIAALLHRRPKRKKQSETAEPPVDEETGNPRDDEANNKNYLSADSKDDKFPRPKDDDPEYLPSGGEEEEEDKGRGNLPKLPLKEYIRITIPDLWRVTRRVYSEVKDMLREGCDDDRVDRELAADVVDRLKRKKTLDFETYELILDAVDDSDEDEDDDGSDSSTIYSL